MFIQGQQGVPGDNGSLGETGPKGQKVSSTVCIVHVLICYTASVMHLIASILVHTVYKVVEFCMHLWTIDKKTDEVRKNERVYTL